MPLYYFQIQFSNFEYPNIIGFDTIIQILLRFWGHRIYYIPCRSFNCICRRKENTRGLSIEIVDFTVIFLEGSELGTLIYQQSVLSLSLF